MNALQNKSFVRVGGVESVQFDARIVAATHYDLAERVREHLFREDLFYQLEVVPLRIPALREHIEDLPLLVDFYVQNFVRHDNLPYRRFSGEALQIMAEYTWRGNIRELVNFVQRMLILGQGDEISRQEVASALGLVGSVGPCPDETELFLQPLREARAVL